MRPLSEVTRRRSDPNQVSQFGFCFQIFSWWTPSWASQVPTNVRPPSLRRLSTTACTVSPWRVIAIATSDTNAVTSPGSSVLTVSCAANRHRRSIATSGKSIPPKESGSSIWNPNETCEHHADLLSRSWSRTMLFVYYYEFKNNKRYLHTTSRLDDSDGALIVCSSLIEFISSEFYFQEHRLPTLQARLLIIYVIRYEYITCEIVGIPNQNFLAHLELLWDIGCLSLWYFTCNLCQMCRAAS